MGHNWLPIKYRIEFKLATFVHQCLYEQLFPPYLKELVLPYLPPRRLRSSSQNNVRKPKAKLKNYGQRALAFQAATVWNELPLELKEIDCIKLFKKKLKTHLFMQYFE